MPRQQDDLVRGTLPDPDFIAYLLEPEAFVIAKLDPEFSGSVNGPLNELRVITSVGVPDGLPVLNVFASLDPGKADELLEAVIHLFEEHIVGNGACEVPSGELAKAFDEIIGDSIGIDRVSIPAGCGLVRSSSSWDPDEIEAQRERLRDVVEQMLGEGRWPKHLVGDDESGRKVLRPGVARVIRHLLDGEVDHVYCHTIDRLSRSELTGVPLLLCLHYLSGNVTYLATKVEQFVRFKPWRQESTLLAAGELIDAAADGNKVAGRLDRGVKGRIRRTRTMRWTFGTRFFHASHRRLKGCR